MLLEAASAYVQSAAGQFDSNWWRRQPRAHRGSLPVATALSAPRRKCRACAPRSAARGHEVLAVEMEGAAVAQVCHDYGLPFAAMRTISDRADDSAHGTSWRL